MPRFQLQKKPRYHEASSIPSRNVDMPSHLQCGCAQQQFHWPFSSSLLSVTVQTSPAFTGISVSLLAQLLLALIRGLLLSSVTLVCSFVLVCQLPLNIIFWSSSCKPPSPSHYLSDCPSPAPICPHFLYPTTGGNIFLWFFYSMPTLSPHGHHCNCKPYFGVLWPCCSSSSAQRRPLPHYAQAIFTPPAFGWAQRPAVEDGRGNFSRKYELLFYYRKTYSFPWFYSQMAYIF